MTAVLYNSIPLLALGWISSILYLFQGSDFNFQEYPNKDLDLEDSSSNLQVNDDNKELANITKSIEDTTKKREEKHRSK